MKPCCSLEWQGFLVIDRTLSDVYVENNSQNKNGKAAPCFFLSSISCCIRRIAVWKKKELSLNLQDCCSFFIEIIPRHKKKSITFASLLRKQ